MSEQGATVHLAYDWMIVTYFFLGGLSAGAYVFSVAANYWKQEFKHLAKKSAVLSFIAIAIGMLILLHDLGQPFRAWRLFLWGKPIFGGSETRSGTVHLGGPRLLQSEGKLRSPSPCALSLGHPPPATEFAGYLA